MKLSAIIFGDLAVLNWILLIAFIIMTNGAMVANIIGLIIQVCNL